MGRPVCLFICLLLLALLKVSPSYATDNVKKVLEHKKSEQDKVSKRKALAKTIPLKHSTIKEAFDKNFSNEELNLSRNLLRENANRQLQAESQRLITISRKKVLVDKKDLSSYKDAEINSHSLSTLNIRVPSYVVNSYTPILNNDQKTLESCYQALVDKEFVLTEWDFFNCQYFSN